MRGQTLLLLGLLIAPALPGVAQQTTVGDCMDGQGRMVACPVPPQPGTVWTVLNTIQVVVDDNYAVVKVIADIANRGPDPEFPFAVNVPDDAYVTGLEIVRDGQTYEATIKERDAARQIYDETKAAQQTGGLVEKRGSSVYSFLVNVAEFTNVRATLTYERYLTADRGLYNVSVEAPVSGFGRDLGANFDVTVRHTDGVVALWDSFNDQARTEREGLRISHSVGARQGDAATPFTATYTINPADAGSLVVSVRNGTGYFAHRFRAPVDARDMPVDLVLVMDVSGSMGGLKMQQLQDAAAQVIGMLRDGDRLHLVFFSSDASSPWTGLRNATAEQKSDAAKRVREAFAAGGTNIEAGIGQGFQAFAGVDWAREEGRLPVLVFLTDGQPTSGITDHARLRQIARDANAHGASVFSLAFGRDADWGLVSGLASDGRGIALLVPEGKGAEVDLRRFIGMLTAPVLKNVNITYDTGITADRRTAPILFAGSEVLVVGTFDPTRVTAVAGSWSATGPEGPRSGQFNVPVEGARGGNFLPRLVAAQEIRRLQDLLDAEGVRAEWTQAIRDLALRFGFVTDYTSLVISLPARSTPDPCTPGRPCVVEDRAESAKPTSTSTPSPTPTSSPTTPSAAPGVSTGAAAGGPGSAPAGSDLDGRSNVVIADRSGLSSNGPNPTGASPGSNGQSKGQESTAKNTPGFEAVAAVAGLAVALFALRRRR